MAQNAAEGSSMNVSAIFSENQSIDELIALLPKIEQTQVWVCPKTDEATLKKVIWLRYQLWQLTPESSRREVESMTAMDRNFRRDWVVQQLKGAERLLFQKMWAKETELLKKLVQQQQQDEVARLEQFWGEQA